MLFKKTKILNLKITILPLLFLSVFLFNTRSLNAKEPASFTATSLGDARLNSSLTDELANNLKSYEIFLFDAKNMDRYARSSVGEFSLNLDLESHSNFDFNLRTVDLRSESYYNNSDDLGSNMERPTTYRGHLGQNKSDFVSMSLNEHLVKLMIKKDGKLHYLEPLIFFDKSASKNQYVYYTSEDVIQDENDVCHTLTKEILNQNERNNAQHNHGGAARATNRHVDLAYEADFEYYQAHGALSGFYISGIINDAATALSQLNVIVTVTYSFLHENSNDPYSGLDGELLLEQLGIRHFDLNLVDLRDAAMLFTGRNFYGEDDNGNDNYNVIGMAYSETICQNPTWAIGAVEDLNTAHSRWAVFAHELGHILGAKEHSTSGIMSEYLSTSNNFDTYAKDQIDDHIAAFGDCVAPPPCSGCECSRIRYTFSREDLYTLTKASEFLSKNNYNYAKKALMSYVRNEDEILKILNDADPKYKETQKQFGNLVFLYKDMITNTFKFDRTEQIEEKQLLAFNDFLKEMYKVSKSKSLKSEIMNIRKGLNLMEDRDLKDAIITYDRANLKGLVDFNLQKNLLEQPLTLKISDNSKWYSTLHISLSKESNLNIELIDVSGKLIRTIDQGNYMNGTTNVYVDKKGLSTGMYIVQITNNKGLKERQPILINGQ